MSLGNGNPKEGDKGSNFNYELKVLQGLEAIAISLENQSKYKVYTALVYQSGGDDPQTLTSGAVTQGVSYYLNYNKPAQPWDFSNVGGPVYPDNYNFVATSSDVPNNYGNAGLNYNTGAPVVQVLENTIGNVWFTYSSIGEYIVNSDSLFTDKKTFQFINSDALDTGYTIVQNAGADNSIYLSSRDSSGGVADGYFYATPLEIRVYN